MANDQSDDTKIIAIKILHDLVGILAEKSKASNSLICLVEQFIVPQIKCFSELKDIRIRKALVNTLVATSLVVSKEIFTNKLLPIFQRYSSLKIIQLISLNNSI